MYVDRKVESQCVIDQLLTTHPLMHIFEYGILINFFKYNCLGLQFILVIHHLLRVTLFFSDVAQDTSHYSNF